MGLDDEAEDELRTRILTHLVHCPAKRGTSSGILSQPDVMQ